ncbi:MAG TPA: MFS transporter [Gemmatimonadales bacterium]|nr:MFS transporter [Gemmatimonadales bacterium]
MTVTTSPRAAPPGGADPATALGPLPPRLGWIAAIAFASGFPYGLVNEAIPVYLRTQGVDLVAIGLMKAVTLPWILKFLWAPLVDRYGTRRAWMLGSLTLLTLLMLALVHFAGQLGAGGLPVLVALLVAVVTLSATQDVAIDAYTIESTTSAELGVANSVRLTFYRGAMFLVSGVLIALAGHRGWSTAFGAAAAICGVLALLMLGLPPVRRAEHDRAAPLGEPVRALFARPGIWAVIAFALLFKLDVAALEPMAQPFWVDRQLSLDEIGIYVTTGRLVATVVGTIIGGLVTTRWGILRALWTLGAVQALSALGYTWAAHGAPDKGLIIGAALFESFTAGMGTSAFVAYLMSVCERRYAAFQFAFLSALMALSRLAVGTVSGALAQALGYREYFLLTFVLGLPAFALIPLLRRAGRPEEA